MNKVIITDKGNYIKGNTALAPEIQHNEENNKESKAGKQKVIKERNLRIKNKLKVLRNISLIFIIGVTLIGRYGKIYSLQKQLNTVNQNVNSISRENENLKVELVRFSNIQYIEDVATKKLKMVRPTKQSMIYCDMNKEIFKYDNNNKDENKVSHNTLKEFFSKLF